MDDIADTLDAPDPETPSAPPLDTITPAQIPPEAITTCESRLREALAQPGQLSDANAESVLECVAVLLAAMEWLLGGVLEPIGTWVARVNRLSQRRLGQVINAIDQWATETFAGQDSRLGNVTGQIGAAVTSSIAERAIRLATVADGRAVPSLDRERTPGTTMARTTVSGPFAGSPGALSLWQRLDKPPPANTAAHAVDGAYTTTGAVYAWAQPDTGKTWAEWFPPGTSPDTAASPDRPNDLPNWQRYGPLPIDRFSWGVADANIAAVWAELPAVLSVRRAIPAREVTSATTTAAGVPAGVRDVPAPTTGGRPRPLPVGDVVPGLPPGGVGPGGCVAGTGDTIGGGGPGPTVVAGGCCPPVDWPDLTAMEFWPGAAEWRDRVEARTPGMAEAREAPDAAALDALSRVPRVIRGHESGIGPISSVQFEIGIVA